MLPEVRDSSFARCKNNALNTVDGIFLDIKKKCYSRGLCIKDKGIVFINKQSGREIESYFKDSAIKGLFLV